MIFVMLYLPFYCIILDVLYVHFDFCMLLYRKEVVYSKVGVILNFRPIEFLVPNLQMQTLSKSHMSRFSV